MAGSGRPLTRCCKMRCRISAMKGGTKLCNVSNGGKLNRGDGKIQSHGQVNREGDVLKRPIRRGGVRINGHGDLYVPDSDKEGEADAPPCKIRRADARPCKIQCGGLRMDIHDVLDVPDSEEEDSDMEVEASSAKAEAGACSARTTKVTSPSGW